MDTDGTVQLVGICHLCVHFDRSGEGAVDCCAAFPLGIPDPVRFGEHDHHLPYPGDHGITFQELAHE